MAEETDQEHGAIFAANRPPAQRTSRSILRFTLDRLCPLVSDQPAIGAKVVKCTIDGFSRVVRIIRALAGTVVLVVYGRVAGEWIRWAELSAHWRVAGSADPNTESNRLTMSCHC